MHSQFRIIINQCIADIGQDNIILTTLHIRGDILP
jgi:hypothetical protein